MIIIKIIELSDWYNLINNSELNKRIQYACIITMHYYFLNNLWFLTCLYIKLFQTYYDILKIERWKKIASKKIRILDNVYD